MQSHRLEGIRGLYRGVGISAAGMGVYLAASFWAYDELNARLPTDRDFRKSVAYPIGKMGAGALAGVFGQVRMPRRGIVGVSTHVY